MARIRSIKPEYWTDGTNMGLSDSCALFFIGLWNFCDDEGKHRLDLNQLVAELGGRWHRGKVKLFTSCLVKSGQLRINSDSTWLQVVGWSHQKIDKPKQPDVNSKDLQWLDGDEAVNALESSREFGARIGSDRRDRIGSDRDHGELQKRIEPSAKREPSSPPDPSGSPALRGDREPTPAGVYISAYQERYGHRPPFGEREGRILGTFAKNHPGQWAELIRGYLLMPDSWAVARSHPVEVLIKKVNEVARFLATGKVVTRKAIEHAEDAIDKAQGTNRKPRRSLEELEKDRAKMLLEAAKGVAQ